MTSSWRLAKNLNVHKCKHPHDFVYSQVAGNKTALTAYYPEAMVRCIATSLYPSVIDKDVPAMPTCAFKQHDHVASDQPEPELESTVFAGVHHLIDRRDWRKRVGYQQAIDKEANGLIANQTWSYDEVVPRDVLLATKEPLNSKHWQTYDRSFNQAL